MVPLSFTWFRKFGNKSVTKNGMDSENACGFLNAFANSWYESVEYLKVQMND